MKGLILSFVGVILLSMVVELFCPQKKMGKSVMSAFSLVVILIIVSGVRNLFFNNGEENFNLSNEISYSVENLSSSSARYMEAQLKAMLETEGIEGVLDVCIEYEVNELEIKYSKIIITLTKAQDEDKIIKIVNQFMPSVMAEDIVIK